MLHANLFHEYADRMIPVAVIPMHTPQEALEELEYAVQQLGMRAIMMAGHVRRPIPAIADIAPQAARATGWLDTFGLDSTYDYDPVWAMGWNPASSRRSPWPSVAIKRAGAAPPGPASRAGRTGHARYPRTHTIRLDDHAAQR